MYIIEATEREENENAKTNKKRFIFKSFGLMVVLEKEPEFKSRSW